ncbi:hypothetical protein CsSME_00051168 [Camellia sinensis var. sinensis]
MPSSPDPSLCRLPLQRSYLVRRSIIIPSSPTKTPAAPVTALSPLVAAVAPQSSPAPNPIRHLRKTRILCYPNWSLIHSPPWSAGTETPNEYSENYAQEDSGRWSEELVGELRGGIMRCSSRCSNNSGLILLISDCPNQFKN